MPTRRRVYVRNPDGSPVLDSVSVAIDVADVTFGHRERKAVDMRLEVVVVPVSDVDRAVPSYKGLGWRLDGEYITSEDLRVAQLTPPGSPCSVIIGTGLTPAAPGSAQGMHLVVTGINAARDELTRVGAEFSEVFHDSDGVPGHSGSGR